ncbi:hypothetical protein C0991_000313 [Blastosporella zonata]|nr:hypothetical protein C0991_000313 [Blastosporella zonata]
MPAIVLPTISLTAALSLPAAPSDPPSKKDVALARHLANNALIASSASRLSHEDFANVVLYEQKVVSKAAEDAPQAFGDERLQTLIAEAVATAITNPLLPINRTIDEIRTSLGTIETDITSMKDDITSMKDDITSIKNDMAAVKCLSSHI